MTKINIVVTNITAAISMATLLSVPLSVHAQSSGNGFSKSSGIGFADSHVCVPSIIDLPQSLVDAPPGNDDEQPTSIEGDEIETEDGNLIKLIGNAQVVQGKRGVFADEINFNKEAYKAVATGNVRFYTGNGDEISAEALELEVDTFIGTAANAGIKFVDSTPYFTSREHYNFEEDYSILAPFRNKIAVLADTELPVDGDIPVDENIYVRARANAATIEFEGKDFQVLNNATLTTCAEGDDSVLLSAKTIELDHIEGVGTATNMTVKFKNVPIFYFPKVSFPINDERKSGFLFPGFTYEDDSGTIIEVPYYINIDPQRDATITPRLLSKRGVQVYAEYRYLTEKSRGDVRVEYLPGDDVFGDDRHAISFNHEHTFNDDWEADVDLQDVSDTSYLGDFSSDIDVSSSAYIPQKASLDYFGDKIRFNAKVSSYQLVNDDVDITGQPYERLPSITLDLKPQDLGILSYGLDSSLTNYSNEDSTVVDGTRILVKPYLSVPLEELYGYITPKLSLQSISYSLDNNPTGDDSPGEVIPIASIDSGLFFERLIKRPNATYLQTLEPRLFYVNIPEKLDQEAFPDFDTGGGSSSSFSHFFRENRFFGGDRVGDTNQLSFGLTSRLINDDTGLEKLKVSIGKVFYFADREVGLKTDSEAETEDSSDFIAEVSTNLSEDWSLRGFGRWTAEENELERFTFSADYFHSSRRNGSVSYSQTIDTVADTTSDEQINLKLEAPLGAHWQMDARADYSIIDSELRSSELGFVYDGCCWALGFSMKRYLKNSELQNRYTLTLELDDLGKISSRL